MASLTINSVGKKYGNVRAIANVSIEVKDGEFLVLVGPSGCGKSTLLRMIAGLESLTEGTVYLGDRDVSNVDPKDRDVAMVFQSYALYPHMTVYENMAFGLQQRKVPRDEIKKKVMDAARILDLQPLVDRKPGALSGGQRQRVAMGRAIVRNPAIYLMDEPLSNLDAKLRVQMRAELKLLRKKLGVTTIYVTHDQVEAMTLGDRVAVLSPFSNNQVSNLEQCDNPQNLYHRPCNMFVAGFIGSPAMNFFFVDIDVNAEELLARFVRLEDREPGTLGSKIILRLNRSNCPTFEALSAYAGSRVVLGVRPEFLGLKPHGEDDLKQSLNVDVTVSELVGPDAFLHFDLSTPEVGLDLMELINDGESGPSSEARYTARVNSEGLREGESRIELFFDVPRLHFFDAVAKNRIF